ncbi:AI-2E family transporter [Alteromonadaceae bacterium M269]|nr:AI-2E family transporter [Alteromonadaceae bacterium M269]
MINVLEHWYKRKFSDPDSSMLLILLFLVSLFLILWGHMLTPVFVAVTIAYLLDWPVARMSKFGISRAYASTLVLIAFISISILVVVGLLPAIWQQGVNFMRELPQIWGQGQEWVMTLPDKYPDYIRGDEIEKMLSGVNERVVEVGEQVISASVSSLVDLAALLIYLILVPLMVFFMLKDKGELMDHFTILLPKRRRLIKQVGTEMNVQIMNYIRGKVVEIIIVGGVSAITFALMDLRYALLLGVLVGFSVLIPFIGAAVVTLPVLAVALFQWGISPNFYYIVVAYGIIQALDGNLLVPLLFSEAVSLHPVYIIIAVLFFGSLWGFWGVFFAIPLATLVKALINAWSGSEGTIEEGEAS